MTCKHWATGQHANAAEPCGYCELERQLAVERERADYAWKNTRTIDAARMEEMAKRDAAEREVALLREALEPFADIRYPDAFPAGAGFASRRNGGHVSYGDIQRARELLRSNAKLSGLEQRRASADCDRSRSNDGLERSGGKGEA